MHRPARVLELASYVGVLNVLRARPNRNVRELDRELHDRDTGPWPSRAIANEHDLAPVRLLETSGIAVMANKVVQRILAKSFGLCRGAFQTRVHRAGHLVDAASAQRVVWLAEQHRPPGRSHEVAAGSTFIKRGERDPRLDIPHELTLTLRIAPLLRRSAGERSLQRPGEPVRIAQLAVHLWQLLMPHAA